MRDVKCRMDALEGESELFIAGGDIDEVIRGYRTITGKAPMLPRRAMGLWQCRERYRTQEQLFEMVEEFRPSSNEGTRSENGSQCFLFSYNHPGIAKRGG